MSKKREAQAARELALSDQALADAVFHAAVALRNAVNEAEADGLEVVPDINFEELGKSVLGHYNGEPDCHLTITRRYWLED
jgi:hypothetical protein